ncbi:hypothetical protein LAJ19_06470 [Deinococcus taeanensis]|uniref:DUF7669 domain-containing protein n=1 Tax=Deinococcus taeanensis TaxID=2737050 RepID=UPI001CDC4E0B|nr:hypothetical protein [Deinococcus taeanensis]UBV43854.1 hypothetical protein LAJ19_06470 [Deinococcus taeanensis]
MTCREEVLAAARILTPQHADGTFSVQDIVSAMRQKGTLHLDTVIRRHVNMEMCANATGARAGKYKDLERVARGRYRLLP